MIPANPAVVCVKQQHCSRMIAAELHLKILALQIKKKIRLHIVAWKILLLLDSAVAVKLMILLYVHFPSQYKST